jgi:asparagine N-glycosylation enzyme membrane subunit Stt3
MNINKNQFKSLIWIIPAVIAFFLALIPTLKYQWPLSWDIIYHVQYAQVYAKYGFVLIDPLLNAPFGQKIGYPPLFHFLLVLLGAIIKIDYFQISRFLQPFLVMFLVLSVSYVARKFYGTIAGMSAGFLIISSLLLGNRLIFPIPENLALIFLPLSVYFYYYSLKEKTLKYAIMAGLLLIVILSIHQAATLVLFLIITAFTLVELIFYGNIHVFKNFGAFILFPLSVLMVGFVAIFLWSPNIIYSILNLGIKEATGFVTSLPSSRPIGISSYGNLGFMALIFGLTGTIVAIKKRRKEDVFILSWIIIIFLLINAYIFGINVISYRLLPYILIPLSILGGLGINEICRKLKDYKKFSSKNFRTAFLISIFVLATFEGLLTVESPLIASFEISNQYGTIQIAPPSDSEIDLARWFNENGDKSKSILSNNLFPMTFVTAQTGMPLRADLTFENFNKNVSESTFKQDKIGYVVLDKRLSFQSNNGTIYKVLFDAEFYRIFYYSGEIPSNIDEIVPSFMKLVYQNKDFMVFQVP